jgi:transposase-like protein
VPTLGLQCLLAATSQAECRELRAPFAEDRRQIRSTNPQERLNKEIKRPTAVVRIFPTRASLIRLVGMVLFEQDDEWQDGRRYFRPETMTTIDAVVDREEVSPTFLLAS